jgi:hypothetical protein
MNEAKLKKKRRIIAEKKKGKGVPKNLKWCQWIFSNKKKDIEYDEDTVNSAKV